MPLLAQPAIAEFMVALGQLGLEALDIDALHRISRLYWYTVEFGLVRQQGDTRIYGAGILSSFGETRYALEDPKPHRLPYDLERVMRTSYRSDAFQESYFVVESFEEVLRLVDGIDFSALCARLDALPDIDPLDSYPHEVAA